MTRLLLCSVVVSLISSCTPRALNQLSEVRTYHLRSTDLPDEQTPMVRAQVQSLLRGAVTMEEMKLRLGMYYLAAWSVSDVSQPVELNFEYRQARTASKIHSKIVTIQPTSTKEQITEFNVIGQEYQERGQVLVWRITMSQGGRVLSQKQSFLWD